MENAAKYCCTMGVERDAEVAMRSVPSIREFNSCTALYDSSIEHNCCVLFIKKILPASVSCKLEPSLTLFNIDELSSKF